MAGVSILEALLRHSPYLDLDAQDKHGCVNIHAVFFYRLMERFLDTPQGCIHRHTNLMIDLTPGHRDSSYTIATYLVTCPAA